jgi:carbamoyltransferase
MSEVYGKCGPRFKTVPRFAEAVLRPVVRRVLESRKLYRWDSTEARRLSESFQAKIAAGETVYLVGLGAASHNTGVSLLECSAKNGVRVLSNDEEERFRGEKHTSRFPTLAIQELQHRLSDMRRSVQDIHCVLVTWDYAALIPVLVKGLMEHAPRSLFLPRDGATHGADPAVIKQVWRAASLLDRTPLFTGSGIPIVMMGHHENHAYMAYAASPFIVGDKPTLIAVLDGFGDTGAISFYLAQGQSIGRLYSNRSLVDSLGVLYGVISSTQGGWTVNSSEGRYMGAAAWGDSNRLTNKYYRRLREVVHLAIDGEVKVNREMCGWHLGGLFTPYQPALEQILGEPIPLDRMWNPDAVLSVDDVAHADVTAERVDKAAALQLVFEDALVHVVDHWVRKTQADQLILSGGAALNCVANMRLTECLDESYYERHTGRRTRLSIWIPPTPGDAGTPIGAAVQFAMRSGVEARCGCFPSPYLCGRASAPREIEAALDSERENLETQSGCTLNTVELGDCGSDRGREQIAAFMAWAVSQNAILGIYQGPAETGPRALGNRSILANPCNPDTLQNLNAKVKFRERIRPLAPMVTRRAAEEFFDFPDGGVEYNSTAYEYMVLTVHANAKAKRLLPAIVHKDGTSRIQIVRPEINPLMYDYLLAMGEILGCEVSVNTSLNVGSPIAQTPAQALHVLGQARALDGLIMIADCGRTWAVWLEGVRSNGSTSEMWKWLELFGFESFEIDQKVAPALKRSRPSDHIQSATEV